MVLRSCALRLAVFGGGAALLAAGAGFGAHAYAQSATTQPAAVKTGSTSTKPAPQAVNKMCPVQTDNSVDDRVPTITYDGKVIGFCCDDCRAAFLKDPDQYIGNVN